MTQQLLDEINEIRWKAHDDFHYFCNDFVYIVDKASNKVNLKLNKTQQIIDDKISELEKKGKPVRIIILKSRQTGVSTYSQAKFLHKTSMNFNKTALVVAHTDKSTNAIFNKTKFMFDNMPEFIKPMRKASNAQELIFDRPSNSKSKEQGLNSRFKISTAGGTGIGRGDTHHYVHLSELAFYEGDVKNIFIGIMQSVPKTPESIVLIESTANGYNFFFDLWQDAVEGKNEFVPMFFSWLDHYEYRVTITDDERRQIRESLNSYERMLVDSYNATEEQLAWYRSTLASECAGDIDLMKQEYPSFPNEAFMHTGRPVFNLEKVQNRIEYLTREYKEKPFEAGYIEYDSGKDAYNFVPDKNGTFFIYEKPKEFMPYVMGVDVAEGLHGGDYSVATVCDNTTGNQVCVLRLHINPDEFAAQILKLARYYNDALVAIELNNHGRSTRDTLSNIYHYYNQFKKETVDDITKQKKQEFGFLTTTSTRPQLIDNARAIVRDNTELVNDLATLHEMATFIFDDSGKPTAEVNCHDDCVMAFAIMHIARSQQRTYSTAPKPTGHEGKETHWSVLVDSVDDPVLKQLYEDKYRPKGISMIK